MFIISKNNYIERKDELRRILYFLCICDILYIKSYIFNKKKGDWLYSFRRFYVLLEKNKRWKLCII